MARSLRAPGIDPRTWIAQGTVGTTSVDGAFNPTDGQAIYIDQDGVLVDVQVILHNGEVWPTTARYNGLYGGPGLTIYAPIRPGDEVLVAFPSGNVETGVIIGRMNNPGQPIRGDTPGATPGDEPPTWQNDRLVINASEPLQIKAPSVTIEAGIVTINGRTVVDSTDPL
jgi:hypothetical protein